MNRRAEIPVALDIHWARRSREIDVHHQYHLCRYRPPAGDPGMDVDILNSSPRMLVKRFAVVLEDMRFAELALVRCKRQFNKSTRPARNRAS